MARVSHQLLRKLSVSDLSIFCIQFETFLDLSLLLVVFYFNLGDTTFLFIFTLFPLFLNTLARLNALIKNLVIIFVSQLLLYIQFFSSITVKVQEVIFSHLNLAFSSIGRHFQLSLNAL
jgi:hypothetical protein